MVGMTADSRWIALGLMAVLGAGCGGTEPEWSGEVTDSAGVAIVLNRGPGLWSSDAWSLTVDLSIGPDESRPETLFGYVADVAVDGVGRLYVLDQHAQAVQVFAADGVFRGTIGGPGEGPGELSRFAASLIARGDTLMVADWGRARVHVFLLDGTFIESRLFPGQPGSRTWWRAGADGSLWYRQLARYTDEDGRWRGHDGLFSIAGAWESPDSVFGFRYEEADLGGPGDPKLPLVVNTPSWDTRAGGGVVWSVLSGTRVHVHGPDGSLEAMVTRDSWAPSPPTAEEEATLLDLMRDKMAMLGGSRSVVDNLPVEQPERLPAITMVRTGPDGTLWVQRRGPVEEIHAMALNAPDPPTAWGGREWDVFDTDHRFLGTLEMPERFRLSRITDEAVYGVAADALGSESVIRLRMERPAAGAG